MKKLTDEFAAMQTEFNTMTRKMKENPGMTQVR